MLAMVNSWLSVPHLYEREAIARYMEADLWISEEDYGKERKTKEPAFTDS